MISLSQFIKRNFGVGTKRFKQKVNNGEIATRDSIEQTLFSGKSESYSNNAENAPSTLAIIAKSEIDFISRCILDYKHIETGGQLFGDWTADGTPRVLYAIGPGRNANHESTFFNQDVDYLVKVGRLLNEEYGLQHIGEWHSHHQLGLAHPSGHDASNMVSSIRNNHLGRFLLCIGNCTETNSTINAFNFTEQAGQDYIHAKWLVKQFESMRLREFIDRELDGLLIHPKTVKACHGNLYLHNASITFEQNTSSPFAKGYWLTNKSNAKEFASIKAYLEKTTRRSFEIKLVESDKTMSLTSQLRRERMTIHFPLAFPESSPEVILTDDWGRSDIVRADWSYNEDIYQSFVNYIIQIL